MIDLTFDEVVQIRIMIEKRQKEVQQRIDEVEKLALLKKLNAQEKKWLKGYKKDLAVLSELEKKLDSAF